MQEKEKPWLPNNFGGFILYRIYYGDVLVYLGRTKQPLQSRIHGHLFKKPMHREICIDQVTKIEYATFKTEADMYLYEIYFINLWHPPLNKDDKAHDDLTVQLPEVEWKLFKTPLWDKWKIKIHENDEKLAEARKKQYELIIKCNQLRVALRKKEISEDVYNSEMDKLTNMY